MRTHRTVLIANPSPDVYGSDLQMLETISAFVDDGWRVVVVVPEHGELIPMITSRGAEILFAEFPVVRRANASARGMAELAASGAVRLPHMRKVVRSVRPDLLYVNTVTLPWWLLVGRLTGTPTVCHVHEAENRDSRAVQVALNGPLLLAQALIVISTASMQSVADAVPRLRRRCRLIYNGVPGPGAEPVPPLDLDGRPYRVSVVGRLSPRKGTDVALDAVGLLRQRGRDVELVVGGTAYAGYEWFVEELRERSGQPDLAGAVTFSGYVSPVWPVFAEVDAALAPSRREPFGNAVVEAQLARRPVVAAAAMGHLETVMDGVTGLLVEVGSASEMADAVERLIDDPDLAEKLADGGRTSALDRFSPERYRKEIASLGGILATGRRRHLRR